MDTLSDRQDTAEKVDKRNHEKSIYHVCGKKDGGPSEKKMSGPREHHIDYDDVDEKET